MSFSLPHTIENKYGEKLTFLRMEGQRVFVEGFVAPQAGPAMHTHWRQDECLTVVSGKMAYQIAGQEPVHVEAGESILFKQGVPHRFWNAGDDTLHIAGWVDPAENFMFFLSALYDAFNAGENQRPELFAGAYLIRRYRGEYDLPEMPGFVKNVLMRVVYGIGSLLGKYRKFDNAPQPL
ncbi:MAG: cupin domain-containing protein [Saprospiraceae bacterium]